MVSQKLGNFSIPIHELMGMLKSLTAAEEYVQAIPELLSWKDTLIMTVFLDSMCSAATLSPHKTHKSVAPRNLTTKIQRVSKAICSSSPNIQIFFAHFQSSSLPADLNSKKVENPLTISSSKLWKSGPDEYFQLKPPDNWFLKITSTEMEWNPPLANPKISTSLFCSCNLSRLLQIRWSCFVLSNLSYYQFQLHWPVQPCWVLFNPAHPSCFAS